MTADDVIRNATASVSPDLLGRLDKAFADLEKVADEHSIDIEQSRKEYRTQRETIAKLLRKDAD